MMEKPNGSLSFSALQNELKTLPKTWYPALLKSLVEGATRADVYQPGALVRETARWIEECKA